MNYKILKLREIINKTLKGKLNELNIEANISKSTKITQFCKFRL